MTGSRRDELARVIDPTIYPHLNHLTADGWKAAQAAADAVLAYLDERGIDLDDTLTRAREDADARGDS